MNLNALPYAWLGLASFIVGSMPFSVWLGRLFLKQDIRAFGDHNPGAANVFRAGSPVLGMAAVILDIGKGVPFVLFSKYLGLSQVASVAIGLAAVLGHAFSPWLHFRGGKGVAVTYGVLIGLWHTFWLFPFCVFALLGVLLWESHAWVMLLTPAETIVFLILTRSGFLAISFMLCIQALFTFKFASDIDGPPRLRVAVLEKLMPWRQP